LSAVKLWKSVSISGPSRHVESDRAKKLLDALERARRGMAGRRGQGHAPAEVTSSAPSASRESSSAAASASRRAASAASIPSLAELMRAPASRRAPGASLARSFIAPASAPDFPKVTRLDPLELIRVVRAAELGDRTRNNFIQFDHLKFDRLGAGAPPSPGRTGSSVSVLSAELGLCLARELRERLRRGSREHFADRPRSNAFAQLASQAKAKLGA